MASIGPQLPPHLSKRKRDDEESPDSPPAKVHAAGPKRTNRDEIDLESDSEDDYGPSVPGAAPKLPIKAGPILPPSNKEEIPLDGEEEEDDDNTIWPTAPSPAPKPHLRSPIGPSLPPAVGTSEIPLEDEDDDSDVGPAPPEPKRVHGPALPPAALSERPPTSPNASDSDSDDDYGPALPTSSSHITRQAQAQELAAQEAAQQSSAPKRDDWMLAPPTSDRNDAPDPTKLRARKFNSGPRANTSADAGGGGGISSIWTETPEQKRKRLENAVLGRSDPSSQQQTTTSTRPTGSSSGKEADQSSARIRDFTEATRGRSLYEEHQREKGGRGTGQIQEEEDDPSKRAFDREKDMRLGGKINTAQRRQLLNKAADFGGRFAKGKYL
ncbi:hypothetical protein F4778DRAFT_621261 [Xylariomycetidae sp. FL2044]|nr:hypothetical protein F4778DRAFT_621261 [Xylariomycetidae sp. FL2044]